jgi:hypothetical protein
LESSANPTSKNSSIQTFTKTLSMSLNLYGHWKKWKHHQSIQHFIQNIGQGIEIVAHILIATYITNLQAS